MRTLGLTVIVLIAVSRMALAATIYVPGHYPTITAGINAAVSGDTVLVAPSTYYENIDFQGKDITLKSESGPKDTVIDGGQNGSVIICKNGEGSTTILEGFTITNGTGTPNQFSNLSGGGMYNCNGSSPTVRDCIFFDNEARHGGGMYNTDSSSPEVTNCTFLNNSGEQGAGGLHNYDNCNPSVEGCTFSNNWAGDYGGGMNNWNSNPTVTDCIFTANSAISGGGGGMFNDKGNPVLTNCIFSGNITGSEGGGMRNYYGSSPTLTNCLFFNNSAGEYGGGMLNFSSDSFGYSSPTLTNCTFSNNSAVKNGGGMYSKNKSKPTMTNCILWNDTPDELFDNGGALTTVEYSCVQGGHPGTGNILEDPHFIDPKNGIFYLPQDPCPMNYFNECVDTGIMDVSFYPELTGRTTRMDGVPDSGTVDMGYHYPCPCNESDFFADLHDLPESGANATVNFYLKAGVDYGNRNYLIVAGVSGTYPGTSLPGGYEILPINWDIVSDVALIFLNTTFFQSFYGTFPTNGHAAATMDLPVGTLSGQAGLQFHFAYCINGPFDFASEPVEATVVN